MSAEQERSATDRRPAPKGMQRMRCITGGAR